MQQSRADQCVERRHAPLLLSPNPRLLLPRFFALILLPSREDPSRLSLSLSCVRLRTTASQATHGAMGTRGTTHALRQTEQPRPGLGAAAVGRVDALASQQAPPQVHVRPLETVGEEICKQTSQRRASDSKSWHGFARHKVRSARSSGALRIEAATRNARRKGTSARSRRSEGRETSSTAPGWAGLTDDALSGDGKLRQVPQARVGVVRRNLAAFAARKSEQELSSGPESQQRAELSQMRAEGEGGGGNRRETKRKKPDLRPAFESARTLRFRR